jgi:hypothetical protein
VRARGQFARPFTLVEEIRRNAEKEHRSREQELQEKLRETERKLNDLQRARADVAPGEQFILSPEQQAELDRFNQERADTRRQLRDVQLTLRKDVEMLGRKAKFWNIFAVPLAVAAAAIALGVWRGARYRRDRAAAGAAPS